jgi:hypothetical protein
VARWWSKSATRRKLTATLVVDDCRLMDNGEIQPSFGNFHDAMMDGHLGQYITLKRDDNRRSG